MVCYYLPTESNEGWCHILATKEQRQNKQFVEKLLQIQGIKYDDWVDEIHVEYMQSNNKLIFEALDSKISKTKEKKEEKEVVIEEKKSTQSFNPTNSN